MVENFVPKMTEKQIRREELDPIYGETRRRLRRVNESLINQKASCSIEVMGVSHIGHPGPILQEIEKADIVTLELIRGVVAKGLGGESGNVLKQNIFWSEIIQHLKNDSENKLILGVSANRDVRNAGKRLNSHNHSSAPNSYIYAVEIEEKNINKLEILLSAGERETLEKYKWIMVENHVAVFAINQLVERAEKQMDISTLQSIPLTDWLTLVHSDVREFSKRHLTVSFNLPPDPSVLDAEQKIYKVIETSFPNFLSAQEIKSVGHFGLEAFLYSPSDLTEAREITYALDQFIKKKGLKPNQHIKVIHLGGAVHTSNIVDILKKSLPRNHDAINIAHTDDIRTGSGIEGGIEEFFRKNIPFSEAYGAISLSNHELTIDSEKTANLIRLAITNDRNDLLKRILIDMIITEKYKKSPDILNTYKKLYVDQRKLYSKDLNYLQDYAKKLNLNSLTPTEGTY